MFSDLIILLHILIIKRIDRYYKVGPRQKIKKVHFAPDIWHFGDTNVGK